MKKILLIAVCCLVALPVFCQGPGKQTDKKPGFNKIRAEKVAFFTNELDLTPEEAEQFWPVYNQYMKECRKAHDATMEALKEVCTVKENNLQKKEIEAATDKYVKAFEAENQVLSDFYPKFKKVLPIEKVAKLFKAEEDFRIKMIRGLREPR